MKKDDELKNKFAVNDEISAKQVRLVGENVANPGVFSIHEALRLAEDLQLDLVELNSEAKPPVCKIIDFQKFLFQQRKKLKEAKAKAAKVVVKEIRFGPQTNAHDFNFKLNHAISFLKDGNKVRAYVFFKGRSILFKEQGELLLLRLAQELDEWGKPEQLPKLEGKRMLLTIAPKKLAPPPKAKPQATEKES